MCLKRVVLNIPTQVLSYHEDRKPHRFYQFCQKWINFMCVLSPYKEEQVKNGQSWLLPHGSKYSYDGVDFDVWKKTVIGTIIDFKCKKTWLILGF